MTNRILKIELGPALHGWLPVRTTHDDFELQFNASMVPVDTLSDLITALRDIVTGVACEVRWNLEPETYFFEFYPENDRISFRVSFMRNRTSKRSVVYEIRGTASEVIIPFYRAIRKFQTTHTNHAHWPLIDEFVMAKLKESVEAMKGQDVQSFDESFLIHLEYHLNRTFAQTGNDMNQGFWCDGISMPFLDSQLSKKSVNDTRKIVTKAWLGDDGQIEYEMTIRFGKYALRKYAHGKTLTECIPDENSDEWISVDTERKTISIQLK